MGLILGENAHGIRRLVSQAMRRQHKKAVFVARKAGVSPRLLSGQPLSVLQEFSRAVARHQMLKAKWLAYEVDPKLQLERPDMSDPVRPSTARMIRAMKAAEGALTQDPGGYKRAVEDFESAFTHAVFQKDEKRGGSCAR